MRKGSAAKRFRSLLQGLFCAGFLTMFPPGLTAEEEQRPQETARIDLVSLPKAAENLSRLGDAVAPEFPLSVFAATAFLGMAQPAMLMDVTKPFSIIFYEGKPEPGICISAQSRANVRSPERTTLRFGSVKMNMEPGPGSRLIFHTLNLQGVPPEPFTPRADQSVTLEIRANPSLLRRQFTLASLASGHARSLPTAADDFLSAFRELNFTLGMPAQNRIALHLGGRLTADSSLPRYLENPAPLHAASVFADAQELFILNIPADRVFRTYLGKLLPHLRGGTAGPEKALYREVINASNGRISIAVAFSGKAGENRRPVAKAVFGLATHASSAVGKTLEAFPETPFGGLRTVAREMTPDREEILFARMEKTGIVFYFCGMVQAELQTLLKEKTIPLDCGEPFAVYDLRTGRKIASLQCRGGRVSLNLDADQAFFRQFPPLIDRPLHALNFKRTDNPRKQRN